MMHHIFFAELNGEYFGVQKEAQERLKFWNYSQLSEILLLPASPRSLRNPPSIPKLRRKHPNNAHLLMVRRMQKYRPQCEVSNSALLYDLLLEASIAIRSKMLLTKLFKIAIALFEIPVSSQHLSRHSYGLQPYFRLL
jgi:hypothetical protein